MKLKNVELAAVFDINVFNEVFIQLYRDGIIPNRIVLGNTQVDVPVGNATIKATFHLTVVLNEPDFVLRGSRATDDLHTSLHLTGSIQARPMDRPDGAILQTQALDAFLQLDFVLNEQEDDIARLGLRFVGVEVNPTPAAALGALNDFGNNEDVQNLLSSINIDVFGPMIDSLQNIYFTKNNMPDRDEWPVSIQLLPGARGTVDSLAAYIALPGQTIDLDLEESFLPNLMGMGLVFSRKIMDLNMKRAGEAFVGKKMDGAKIKKLTLKMNDDFIELHGRAEKGDTVVKFDGPIKILLERGTTNIFVDTSDVDVDVDKPWYYYPLSIAAGILFFVPVIGTVIDFFLIPALYEGALAAERAPGQVRRGLGDAFGKALDVLAAGLSLKNEFESRPDDPDTQEDESQLVTVDSTTDHARTIDGNVELYAQVFVLPITSGMRGATYGYWKKRFTEYELKNRRKFSAPELARLMSVGKITVPDHHQVAEKYVRSNPDKVKKNNLLEEFGPR